MVLYGTIEKVKNVIKRRKKISYTDLAKHFTYPTIVKCTKLLQKEGFIKIVKEKGPVNLLNQKRLVTFYVWVDKNG